MIKADVTNVKQFEADLKRFKLSAYPFATKETLNRGARNTVKVAKDIVSGKMTLRNAWTARSIQYDRARGNDVGRQRALVGSTQPYMATQEFGGVKRAKGTRGVPIATPAASGETSLPRRKLPRRANSLASIQLRKANAARVANRKQRNAIAVAETQGRGFVFLELGRRSGIYRVTGGKRRPKLSKVWDMTRPSVVIPQRRWLLPAVDAIAPRLPQYYADALRAQLVRHGILGQ
jgi:phage gpG-like protein